MPPRLELMRLHPLGTIEAFKKIKKKVDFFHPSSRGIFPQASVWNPFEAFTSMVAVVVAKVFSRICSIIIYQLPKKKDCISMNLWEECMPNCLTYNA
jgi:hypothetical protein